MVAGSSLESEYMALYYCAVEVVYLRNVFDAMGFKQQDPTKIYCDNEAVKSFSEDAKFRDRTRHIDRYQISQDPRVDFAGYHQSEPNS